MARPTARQSATKEHPTPAANVPDKGRHLPDTPRPPRNTVDSPDRLQNDHSALTPNANLNSQQPALCLLISKEEHPQTKGNSTVADGNHN